MAVIGLAIPIAARYSDDGFGNITYTDGRRFAKAVEFQTAFGDKKSNNLYADNSIAESQNSFSGGTITLKTDDLDAEASKLILGLTEEEIHYNGKNVKTLVDKASDTSPYLGFGIIMKGQNSGKPGYVAVILPKIVFSTPADSAKTQGESIEWQTPTITGTIMRDDKPDPTWRYRAEFPTEAAAAEFIKWFLGMMPGTLTVTSAAGATENMTAVTVSPVKTSGGSYKYLLGAEVYMPDKDAIASDAYLDWDGSAEIEARESQKILMVEVDAENKVKRAGIGTVTVNGGAA